MAFCSECGNKLSDGARFCANCGKKIEPTTYQREILYEGKIHKCPLCGEVVNSFTAICPTCGYEFRSLNQKSLVRELAQKIEQTSSLNKKIELITNFYVPNTREDIFDFFILAVSNLQDTVYDTDDAWRAKLEQTYHKARIAFGNTEEFTYLEDLYNKTSEKVRKRSLSNSVRKNKNTYIKIALCSIGVIMLVVGVVLLAMSPSIEDSGSGFAGGMSLMFSMGFLISPLFVDTLESNMKSRNPDKSPRTSRSGHAIGKSSDEFWNENFEDVAEYFRELGFKNILLMPEKKTFLNEEGAVKGISIAGNTEFEEEDEYSLNSKVIIRYYTRNC